MTEQDQASESPQSAPDPSGKNSVPQKASKAKVFVSYRRQDAAGYAGRLSDRLVQRFGRYSVFVDVDTIEVGSDFVQAIEDAVGSCAVLVVAIGNQWLDLRDGERLFTCRAE